MITQLAARTHHTKEHSTCRLDTAALLLKMYEMECKACLCKSTNHINPLSVLTYLLDKVYLAIRHLQMIWRDAYTGTLGVQVR